MNRREFVQSSSVWAAVALTSGPLGAATSPGRKIKIALTPGSIGVVVKSQQELNELAQRHRFEAVEPRAEEIAAMSPEQIAAMVTDVKTKGLTWAAAGLTVAALAAHIAEAESACARRWAGAAS